MKTIMKEGSVALAHYQACVLTVIWTCLGTRVFVSVTLCFHSHIYRFRYSAFTRFYRGFTLL